MEEKNYEIVESLGCCGDPEKWHIELNYMSWNKKEPKYDIRKWNKGHEKMGKGITLTREELEELTNFLVAEIDHLSEND